MVKLEVSLPIGSHVSSLLNRNRVDEERIMVLRAWRFITLLLAALALTMESAHVLELPQKMQYDAQMDAAVNTTLYRYFAIVGGVYQVGSIMAAAVLAFLVRKHRPCFGWTLAEQLLGNLRRKGFVPIRG